MTRSIKKDQIPEAFLAVPGTTVSMFAGDCASLQTIVSGTFADIPGSALPEQQFVVPVAGWYLLDVLLSSLSPSVADTESWVEYQLLVDESDFNGFPEQAIGGDGTTEWEIIVAHSGAVTQFNHKTVSAKIELGVGTHKLKIQAKTNSGSPRVSTHTSFRVRGTLISGSCAGGALADTDTATVNTAITQADPNWQDVAQVDVVCVAGEVLEVMLVGQCRPDGAAATQMGLRIRDGTEAVTLITVRETADLATDYRSVNLRYLYSPTTSGLHSFLAQCTQYNSQGWTLNTGALQVGRYRGGINRPDTRSPKGTWASGTTVDFAARPGQPDSIRLTLQDGKQREMIADTWDVANGVADWGYDEAGSQGNDRWLYFYAVPKSGDDNYLVVRASDNPPSTGPAGYSLWKLVWITYMGTAVLRRVLQCGNQFLWDRRYNIIASSNVAPFAFTAYDLALPATGADGPYVPPTAGLVQLVMAMWHATTAVDRWDLEMSYDGTNVLDSMSVADPASGNHTGHQDRTILVPVDAANDARLYLRLVRNYGSSANVNFLAARIMSWVDSWIDA